jgi:hypothetical protein
LSYTDSYKNGSLINRKMFDDLGGSSRTSLPYPELPHPAGMLGKNILFGQRNVYSTGTRWVDNTPDLIPLTAATNLNGLYESGNYTISDITIHSGTPAGVVGDFDLEVRYASSGYVLQKLCKTSTAKLYVRRMSAGVWGVWSA